MVNATKKSLLEILLLLKRAEHRARIAGDDMYNAMLKVIAGLMLIFIIAMVFNLIGLKIINLPLSILVFIVMMLTFLNTDTLITLLSVQISNTILPEKLQLEPLDDIFVLFLFLMRRLAFGVFAIIALLGLVSIEESFTSFMILIIGGILLSLSGDHSKEYKAVGGTDVKKPVFARIISKAIIFVMVIALINIVITASRIYTNTGYDIKGWFQETTAQQDAFKALKRYNINKNLMCADKWGGSKALFKLMSNTEFLEKSVQEQELAQKCAESITMSNSNPRNDVPAILTTVKSLFAEEPEPQFCGQVTFNPRFSKGSQMVKVPTMCKVPYTISVDGGYTQTFTNGPFFIPAGAGIAVNPIPAEDLAIMPIQNLMEYGVCLINKNPPNVGKKYRSEFINVTVNIPQNNYVFSGISGSFMINFYN